MQKFTFTFGNDFFEASIFFTEFGNYFSETFGKQFLIEMDDSFVHEK